MNLAISQSRNVPFLACVAAFLFVASSITAQTPAHADSDSPTIAGSPAEVPYSLPPSLATLEYLHGDLQKRFLTHIQRAQNPAVAYRPNEFPWKLNEAAQRNYCESVANALFVNRDRLSFSFFDAIRIRDGAQKAGQLLQKPFPNCAAGQWPEMGKTIADQLSKSEKYLVDVEWNEGFFVDSWYFIKVNLLARKTETGVIGDSSVFYQSSAQGQACPSKEFISHPEFSWGDANYSTKTTTLVGAIDRVPTIFFFGAYERDHSRENSRYGRRGQGYVLVDGLRADLFTTWAVAGSSLSYGPLDGWEHSRYGADHLFACVINFDLK